MSRPGNFVFLTNVCSDFDNAEPAQTSETSWRSQGSQILRKKGFVVFWGFGETGQFPSQTTTGVRGVAGEKGDRAARTPVADTEQDK